jgi:threonine synthase
VGATSGDTGSAAIDAVAGRAKVDIFMLHPKGRVSDVQRRQMTTVLAPNVHNIAITGSFDDAQAMVKRMFNDKAVTEQFNIGAVNSINWARLMAQVVYYFAAALQLGAPHRKVAFSVPTGNFGDVFAGYVAAKMGLPIEKLIVATNVNDILHRALSTGDYSAGTVTPTAAPRWTFRCPRTSSACCSIWAAAMASPWPSRWPVSNPPRRCSSPTPSAKAPPSCSPAPASIPTRWPKPSAGAGKRPANWSIRTPPLRCTPRAPRASRRTCRW